MSTTIIFALAATLIILIIALFAVMFSYYYLLKRTASSFPEYYQTLGSPFLPQASRRIFKTISRDRANYRLLGALLTGRPANFPSDARLKKLIVYIRLELFITILSIGVTAGLCLNL